MTYILPARRARVRRAITNSCRRRIVSWRVSSTAAGRSCVDAPHEALGSHGQRERFNVDLGRTFAILAFTGHFEAKCVTISSMFGEDRWINNMFLERPWRCFALEEALVEGCKDRRQASAGIERHMAQRNHRCSHQDQVS